PHVSNVERYGWKDDWLWIVTDRYGARLCDMLLSTQPAQVNDVENLFRQVFHGLRAMHRLGLVHGAVRSKNIYLTAAGDGVAGNGEIAWVGDGAIGHFSWWTSNKLLDSDAMNYAIPGEDPAAASKPSTNRDLYALGI